MRSLETQDGSSGRGFSRVLVLAAIALLLSVVLMAGFPEEVRSVRQRLFKEAPLEGAGVVPRPASAADLLSADLELSAPSDDAFDELDLDAEVVPLVRSGGGSSDDDAAPGRGTGPAEGVVVRAQGLEGEGQSDSQEPAPDGGDQRGIFAELNEAQGSQLSNDEFFSGVRVSQGAGLLGPVEPTPQPTPAVKGLPWLEGQSRGYTMLYAMQPQARAVVERQVQAMLTAHIKDLYIGVLIDGTFGRDFEYLRSIIARLSAEGRRLTVALYLSNGPTMRRWRETTITALFAKINPVEFRQRIRREQRLQSEYLDVARQAQRIFLFNTGSYPANSNVAIVMLEDNLDQASYRVMRDLARSVVREAAVIMRNPCVGCLSGNDGDTLGDAREEHTLERFDLLQPGDAFSFDGIGFAYPGMPPTTEVPSDGVLSVMVNSFAKGLRYVGLWRHEWQGVEEGVPNPHPEQRPYTPSNDDQVNFEVEALRMGLNEVPTEDLRAE
jgi:hypothetical protein